MIIKMTKLFMYVHKYKNTKMCTFWLAHKSEEADLCPRSFVNDGASSLKCYFNLKDHILSGCPDMGTGNIC